MRFAILTTSWPSDATDPSGHFVRAEVRALEREGHSVVVVAPRAGGAFGWPGAAERLRERPSRTFEAARWIASACLLARRLDVDRIVAHWALPCAWPIACATRRAELDVVSHGGDVRLLAALPAALRRSIVLAIVRRARVWRFVSGGLRDQLVSALDPETGEAVKSLAVVLPAAMDLPDVRRAAAGKRISAGRGPIAVSVGRLVRAKRVDETIRYVAETGEARVLVVVGDGPERPRLERLARERGVDARFVGRVAREEALAWIAAADMLIHASRAEGLCTVVREARALGTPVHVL